MKLNQKLINRIFRNNTIELPTIDFNPKNADVLIPYEVKTGFVNTTEEGVVFDNEITNYSQWERIFTGYEAVLAKWEGSTSTYVSGEFPNKKLHKNFKVGKVDYVWISDKEGQDTFFDTKNSMDVSFKTEVIVDTISAYTPRYISDNDIVKFYQLPAKFGDVLFFIESVDVYNDPNTNEFKYSKLNLKSVNNKLTETGVAVKQYIQFAAAGEGYAKPRLVPILDWKEANTNFHYETMEDVPAITAVDTIVYAKGFNGSQLISKLKKTLSGWECLANEGGVILDTYWLLNRPITSFQVEIFGKGVLSDVYFYGRPLSKISNSQDEVINSPRQLLLNDALQPNKSQKDVLEPYARNTEYKLIRNSRLVVESWYKSWKESYNTQMNPAYQKEYMGMLEIFYGKAEEVVNVPIASRIVADIFTLGFAELFMPTTTEFTQANNSLVVDTKTGDFPSIFMNNFLKNKSVPRIPLSYKESVAWNLTQIPFIGGFLNNLTSGLVAGWRETRDLGGRNFSVVGVIPADLLDFYQNALMAPQRGEGDNAYTAIPLNDLQDNSSPETTSKVDYATTLHFTLTDTFTDYDIHNQPISTYNTAGIGYTEVVNGGVRKVAAWDPNQSKPVANTNVAGYAIDLFGLHFLGNADVKMTFFSGATAVYSTRVKTLSSLTGSVRDWNSNYKLSDWSAPAGQVVDNQAPYRFQPSDFTIPAADANNAALSHGFSSGVMLPTYAKDGQGNILLDANGNPIVKVDSNGNPVFSYVDNKLTGAISTGITSYTKTQINQIPEEKLLVPQRLFDYSNNNPSGAEVEIYRKNIKEILSNAKYAENYVNTFSYLKASFELAATTDSGGSTAGNVFSLGIAAIDHSDSTSADALVWEIFRNASNSYDLKWDLNMKDVDISVKPFGTDVYVRLRVYGDGNIVISYGGGSSSARLISSHVNIKDVSVFN